ncbi:LysR family transcriptional regulator [Rhizobium phaseoli]|uniref:LysR family transcriptional regulator n=1 Tax=Rhizobium phaseoli TaxID=396 RepID=UPI000A2A115E|nr:hypothetical protein Kim5_PD00103 [Rhizobium sp. Kim5]
MIAETMSLSDAAPSNRPLALHSSTQLKELERRLGFDLVRRHRGSIALTGAGAIL